MKKIISTFVLSTLFMLGGAGLASAQDVNSNPSSVSQTPKVCMKVATVKKNTSLKTARITYNTALDQSKLIQDKVARKVARELARKNYNLAQKVAQVTFKTDRKACTPTPVVPVQSSNHQ